VAEHPEVARVKVERGEALGEAPMCVGAELGEQETGTAAQVARRGRVLAAEVASHARDGTGQELFLI
jgi:hypothetical protein